MNYLGLIGMLDLGGAADGAPVQSAGQIADLGGGGLMAAYSILAALREAERTGQGQAVDVSMADGALSWLTMVAGQYLADGRLPGRGSESLTGGLRLLPPLRLRRRLRDARRARAEVLGRLVRRGRPRGPDREGVRTAGLGRARGGRAHLRRAHPRRVGRVRRPARLLPRAGARPWRGAGLRPRARARDGGRGRPARAPRRPCGRWATRSSSPAPPPTPPGPARRWASTPPRAGRPGLLARAGGRSGGRGRRGRAAGGATGSFLG